MIRLLLVDDHAAFRQPLGYLLDRLPDMQVVGQAGTVAEAAALSANADVALLDIALPDGSGLELIPALRERDPKLHVVILTASEDPETAAAAFEAGAVGVLRKWVGIDDIVDAIRRVAAGESLISRTEMQAMLRLAFRTRQRLQEADDAFGRLTGREHEVLDALADGLSDKELAQRLGITDNTARVHVTNILSKLGVASRLQAVVYAVRHGAVDLGEP